MGREKRSLTAPEPVPGRTLGLVAGLKRHKPRSYLEWKTLRQWDKLGAWEDDPPGYLLRRLREGNGCSQQELARRLGCSQQAVAQAERWESNPTLKFVRQWARTFGHEVTLEFR